MVFYAELNKKLHNMEQQAIGVVLGATSLFAGYILRKLAQMRAEDLFYLNHVPQFQDFKQLKDHLKNSPNQNAEVLLQGRVEKLDKALTSEKTELQGAARLVTTTTYTKVLHQQEGQPKKWRDMSNTIENLNVSVPFKLVDGSGNHVTVRGAHEAGGFRHVLQRVWQDKVQADSRSLGDFATNMALKEIPNGSLTRQFLLVFGSSIGAYGNAVLESQSLLSSGQVSFTPVEVNSSIRSLISKNEMILGSMKLFSVIFLVGGGSILFITGISLLFRLLERERREDQLPLPSS